MAKLLSKRQRQQHLRRKAAAKRRIETAVLYPTNPARIPRAYDRLILSLPVCKVMGCRLDAVIKEGYCGRHEWKQWERDTLKEEEEEEEEEQR